jgi:hypothetical protein
MSNLDLVRKNGRLPGPSSTPTPKPPTPPGRPPVRLPVNGTYKLAIIRRSILTGQCERSTPDAVDQVVALR